MRANYNRLKEKNAAPKQYKKWSNANKAELTKLMSDDVALNDTEFGRQIAQLKERKKQELMMAFAKHNPEEVAQILASISNLTLNIDSDSNNPNLNKSDLTEVPPMPWL